ncbi:MAG: hypothetical protein ACTH4N_07220 [Corynebacterium casei]|uniref:hypothetical protein n=1 Tax=Corynebacterium casei TaxID=160386 RepID=UPI003F93649D
MTFKQSAWRPRMMRTASITAAAALTVPLAFGAQAVLTPAAQAQEAAAQEASAQEAEEAQHPGWEANSSRRTDRVGFELTGNPGSVSVNDRFNVGLKITNSTEDAIENVQVTARRGVEVTDAEQAQQQLAHGDFPFYGATLFPDSLAPGEETTGDIDIATSLDDSATLAIDKPGFYPIMLSLTGTVNGEPVALADDRFLLTVTEANGQMPEDSGAATASTLVYPITAQTNIAPGEVGDNPLVLSDESLAEQLADGGRLDRLLDVYEGHNLGDGACVALDPALLDTVERMSAGYNVAAEHPPIVKERKRLRDSWFRGNDYDSGVPGTGAEDAERWVERVSDLDCIIAMPWANSDPNAVSRVSNNWLEVEAIERGAETIRSITGKEVASDIVVPASGYSDQTSESEMPLLLADNTGWEGNAATFDANQAALLAQTGRKPQTTAYTDPWLRYDFNTDSIHARDLTAAAAVFLSNGAGDSKQDDADSDTGSTGSNRAEASPTVIKLPNYLEPSTAEAVLDAVDKLPQLRPITDVELETTDQEPGLPLDNRGEQMLSDPTAFTDPEVQRIAQQARYTDELTLMMENSEDIAMTRYGFTLPLRRDLLAALSMTDRVSLHSHDEATETANHRLQEDNVVLRTLRDAVTLIPPGNVYTRTSDASPLLVVAENSLPLPVRAKLEYDSIDAVRLNTSDDIVIPAEGSITVSLTASMPERQERTNISMWLATEDGATISEPVNIAVQTRGGIVNIYGAAIAAALVFVFALVVKTSRKKKRGRQT